MQTLRRSIVAAILATLALSATATAKPPATASAPPLPQATPESQGMSSERLGRLHAEIERFVTDGKHAGVVSLIARNGRIVNWQTYGKRDLEAGLPMEKDTICRIYSMSKIVTSAAALVLLEEARFRLDDLVGDYLPELARMKVLTGGTTEKPLLADAKTPITIKHLFTHTSGLTYGGDTGPIEKIYRDAKLPEATSLPDFVRRVSLLPLAHEPGERFTYSVSRTWTRRRRRSLSYSCSTCRSTSAGSSGGSPRSSTRPSWTEEGPTTRYRAFGGTGISRSASGRGPSVGAGASRGKATRSPPSSDEGAPTCATSRSCSATNAWRRRPSTPVSTATR